MCKKVVDTLLNSQKTVLIFGYGYTASYIAKRLLNNQNIVYGTSRTASINFEFDSNAVNIIKYDSKLLNQIIDKITNIVISIPPDDNGDVVIRNYAKLLLNAKNLKNIIYLSSTAVYGNHDGKIVNENSELKYLSKRACNRVLAEKQWREFGANADILINILRLSGIYGDGRSALDVVKSGKARSIFKANHVFSRIHVQDIAQIITEIIKTNDKFEIYNLADDEPCGTYEVNNYAAMLLNVEAPEIVDIEHVELSEMMREFYADNKIICNKKIKNKLGINLRFPNYRNGLDHIFTSNNRK